MNNNSSKLKRLGSLNSVEDDNHTSTGFVETSQIFEIQGAFFFGTEPFGGVMTRETFLIHYAKVHHLAMKPSHDEMITLCGPMS